MTVEITVPQGAPIPPGYGFLPKGNVFKTARCRRLTHAIGDTLYVVVHPSSKTQPVGILAPEYILDEVDAAEADTRAERAATVARRDSQAATRFRDAVAEQFPHMPVEDLAKLAQHALVKHSGRVGRTGTLEMERKVRLAVEAHIRHERTGYDGMLRGGADREQARDDVWERVREVSAQWSGKPVQDKKPVLGKGKATRTNGLKAKAGKGKGNVVAKSKAAVSTQPKAGVQTKKPRPIGPKPAGSKKATKHVTFEASATVLSSASPRSKGKATPAATSKAARATKATQATKAAQAKGKPKSTANGRRQAAKDTAASTKKVISTSKNPAKVVKRQGRNGPARRKRAAVTS